MINVPYIKQSATINKTGTVLPQNSTPAQTPSYTVSAPNYTKSIYPQTTIPVYQNTTTTPKLTHTSWLYFNDVHGKMTNMERIYNITQEFDRISPNKLTTNFFKNDENISKFKVSSGDIILGANYTHNQVANQFLNWSGVIANTLGNHEVDISDPANFAKMLENSNYKTLAVNVTVDKNSPLYGKIEKSTIIEKDGIKYGLVGIAPPDMYERVKMNDTLKDLKISDADKTIKLVQDEVKQLEAQGIKHIAVLSHAGNKLDKRIAQETEGIDMIFGAHTHNLIEGIKEGENLFYSKRGEPVIITQAGKDGENLGILNLDFDQNGTIKKAQNNIIKTRDFNRPLFIKDSVEDILGKPEVIGKVAKAVPPPANRLIENNPHGNLIADAMRNELGTDIGILNAGNIRGSFSQGPIDTRLISDITPFEDKMMILNLSEKQIVDSIKVGLKSLVKSSHKPGILLVSGLRYKANTKGELLELEFIDKNNNTHKIDVNNPSADKKYTVAADDFYATGGDGYLESNKNPDFVLQKFDIDKNKLACDYIKKLNQPITIEDDHRVQIVEG
ncbi:MAG: 5'-nucleotidase C-terminal domain-containing protein [Muribaculaceae bacterium]|nr:5'-nucleotidase C-terminal domain-containing protein [Muribaculaceae bacterium]